MSVQNIGRNLWRVTVTLGYHPKTGKRIQKSKRVRGTKSDALEQQAIMSGMGVSQHLERMSLARLMQLWLESKTDIAVNTRRYYQAGIDDLMPGLGHVEISELSPVQIEAFFRDNLAGSLATRARKVLASSLKYAVRIGAIAASPMDRVDIASHKARRKRLEAYSAEEARQLLEVFHGSDIEAGVILGLFCGLRRGEICGLDWGDINFCEGSVSVERAYVNQGRGGARIKETKTSGSDRTVPLSGWPLTRLSEISGSPGDPVLAHNGKRMRPVLFMERFQREVEGAGMRYLPVGNLRHTFATLTLSQGVDVGVVSRMLGHTSIQTTVNNYIRPLEQSQRAASTALTEAIAPEIAPDYTNLHKLGSRPIASSSVSDIESGSKKSELAD